ncbi:MAG: DUF535 family protein [Janthinobacterium lividum]
MTAKVRDLSYQPGLLQLKCLFRYCQARLRYEEFQQMRQLIAALPLEALLQLQPRFAYKYLGYYTAVSFPRRARLAAILHHYRFLAAVVRQDFFSVVAEQPVIWQDLVATEEFSIRLSYPLLGWYEGELSLHFFCNATLLQMITFVIVPGTLIGAAAPHTLLVGQVQGTKDRQALQQATKSLHDITPATLLIQAAYGLAMALRITHAAGVSSQEQLRYGGPTCYFNYDAFWQQFRAERLNNRLYLLDIHAPDKPLGEIKAKYRPRTLRKRAYKQQLRAAIAQHCQVAFLAPSPA